MAAIGTDLLTISVPNFHNWTSRFCSCSSLWPVTATSDTDISMTQQTTLQISTISFQPGQCICGLWAPGLWEALCLLCSSAEPQLHKYLTRLVLLALSGLAGAFIPGDVHKETQDHMDGHNCHYGSIEIAVIAGISHGGWKSDKIIVTSYRS